MVTAVKKLKIERHYTTAGVDPLDTVKWTTRTASITNDKGETVFSKENVEVPESWSVLATNIVASKYFCTKETSVRQLVTRVARAITKWGNREKMFETPADQDIFRDELTYMLVNQMGSFNSPVWFNVGLFDAYGTKADGRSSFWYDDEKGTAEPVKNSYERPQGSACFILSVEDTMESIMGLANTEAMLFKFGSGCGTNMSTLRSSRERLSGGGIPSGPLSFMRVFDQVAGVVKSGGKTRRAAKMQILNVTHPDIMDFIHAKSDEEKKAWALIDNGYSGAFGGEAYSSVMFQNSNFSVRLTDQFMQAAAAGKDWPTKAVTTGATVTTLKSRDVLKAVAEGAHVCGDPGVQFDDTINAWNTCANSGRINASNPCQPGWATLLTPEGIRTLDELTVGDTIWSGQQWTKITNKVPTGIKPVYNYGTNGGMFVGTEKHRVVEDGVKIEVSKAQSIDITRGNLKVCDRDRRISVSGVDVMSGLLIGDGAYKSCNKGANAYCLLYIGEDDSSYLDDADVGALITRKPFDRTAHRVNVEPLLVEELPHTYARTVPTRYLQGNGNQICDFLRGLYSANGSMCGGRITLKATSFNIIQDVQQMLSALGIRSYYTTNKSKTVEFSNGTYTCKQSYDLNITTDKDLFARLIGFIQPYKTEKLNKLLTVPKRTTKASYDIHTRKYVGDFPVYDITVDAPEHTYWTGGLLVSNCSEYLGLDNTACNLASLNLMKFIGADGVLDKDALKHAVRIFVIAQEILVGSCSYPTATIAKNSHMYRPLGLGYANLGAVLMSLGMPYDSDQGRDMAAVITSLMTGYAYLTSAEMADVLGPFSEFKKNRDPMLKVIKKHKAKTDALEANFNGVNDQLFKAASDVWYAVLKQGDDSGFRNSQVTVLAPCGTIGFKMDCDTTGIEPDLALVKFKQLVGGGSLKLVNQTVPAALKRLGYADDVVAKIVAHIDATGTIENCPDVRPEDLPIFDCAFRPENGQRFISYMAHLKMMAAVQPFLSGAISKTVNMPKECTVDQIESAYREAWKMGIKAVAVYRDGSKRTQPMNVTKGTPVGTAVDASHPRKKLPATRKSVTHKFAIGGHEGYVTVGLYDDGQPGEMFITMSKDGSTIGGLMNSFATAVSMGLQCGVTVETLVKKFTHCRFEPSGYTGNRDVPFAKSLVDYIFKWIDFEFLGGRNRAQEHDDEHGPESAAKQEDVKPVVAPVKTGARYTSQEDAPPCTVCGSITTRNASCYRCNNCGTSLGCS